MDMNDGYGEFGDALDEKARIDEANEDVADAISCFVTQILTTKWDGKTYHISKTTTNDDTIKEFVDMWKQHNADFVRGNV